VKEGKNAHIVKDLQIYDCSFVKHDNIKEYCYCELNCQ
jgi:hypothetical protein